MVSLLHLLAFGTSTARGDGSTGLEPFDPFGQVSREKTLELRHLHHGKKHHDKDELPPIIIITQTIVEEPTALPAAPTPSLPGPAKAPTNEPATTPSPGPGAQPEPASPNEKPEPASPDAKPASPSTDAPSSTTRPTPSPAQPSSREPPPTPIPAQPPSDAPDSQGLASPKSDAEVTDGILAPNNISRGTAVGIAVGVFLGFALLTAGGVIFFAYRRRKQATPTEII